MFDRDAFEKDFEKKHPISPKDEYIVMFEGVDFDEAKKTLTDVFNKHGKGKLECVLPGGSTWLISHVDWPIVKELKANRHVSAVGPNRKAGFA